MVDSKYNISERYKKINDYNKTLNSEAYDWAKNGVLKKCLPKILFKGNVILRSFLELVDMRIILMLQTITFIKHFKHLTYEN